MTTRLLHFEGALPAQQARSRRDRRRPRALLLLAALAVLAWRFAGLAVNPATLDYGSEQVGAVKLQPLTLTNRGSVEIHPTIQVMGESASDFNFDRRACAGIGAGAACQLPVEFRPRKPGARRAVLVADFGAGESATAELQGTGLPPIVQVSPSELDFPPMLPGQNPAVKQVTITSEGWFHVSGASVEGAAQQDYKIDYARCAEKKDEQKECEISVTFQPRSAGSLPAILRIDDDGAGSPHTVRLIGSGQIPPPPPAMRIEPLVLDFSSQTEQPQPVHIWSEGPGLLKISQISIQGADSDRFTFEPAACPDLPAKAVCAITVRYKPKVFGASPSYSAALQVDHNAHNITSPQSVALRWTRVARPRSSAAIAPKALSFSGPLIDNKFTKIEPRTITIRNDGPVEIANVTLVLLHNVLLHNGGAGDAGHFEHTSNCHRLQPGESCQEQITFSASKPGNYKASLHVTEFVFHVLGTVDLDATVTAPPPSTPLIP